jgi:hypothetical protein
MDLLDIRAVDAPRFDLHDGERKWRNDEARGRRSRPAPIRNAPGHASYAPD